MFLGILVLRYISFFFKNEKVFLDGRHAFQVGALRTIYNILFPAQRAIDGIESVVSGGVSHLVVGSIGLHVEFACVHVRGLRTNSLYPDPKRLVLTKGG